jgi:hypothetical protein
LHFSLWWVVLMCDIWCKIMFWIFITQKLRRRDFYEFFQPHFSSFHSRACGANSATNQRHFPVRYSRKMANRHETLYSSSDSCFHVSSSFYRTRAFSTQSVNSMQSSINSTRPVPINQSLSSFAIKMIYDWQSWCLSSFCASSCASFPLWSSMCSRSTYLGHGFTLWHPF